MSRWKVFCNVDLSLKKDALKELEKVADVIYFPATQETLLDNIIDFDGAVMTDSGGYQVLEYGDVDVAPADMAEFEKGIMTDFAIPLDKPTGYGLSKKKAKSYVNQTLEVSKKTLENSINNGQVWIGPIQAGNIKN